MARLFPNTGRTFRQFTLGYKSRPALNCRLMELETVLELFRNPSSLRGDLSLTQVKWDIYRGVNPWPKPGVVTISDRRRQRFLPEGFWNNALKYSGLATLIAKVNGSDDRTASKYGLGVFAGGIAYGYGGYVASSAWDRMVSLRQAATSGRSEHVVHMNNIYRDVNSLIKYKSPSSFWIKLRRALFSPVEVMRPRSISNAVVDAFSAPDLTDNEKLANVKSLQKGIARLEADAEFIRKKLGVPKSASQSFPEMVQSQVRRAPLLQSNKNYPASFGKKMDRFELRKLVEKAKYQGLLPDELKRHDELASMYNKYYDQLKRIKNIKSRRRK